MILTIDVDYRDPAAFASGILFEKWEDEKPSLTVISRIEKVHEYIPGQFYKRELPCILQLLKEHNLKPGCIVIDGFVYLDGKTKPGLGKYLYDSLNKTIPIIGVAKNSFNNISRDYMIFMGKSRRPLFVTSAGCDLKEAKEHIKSMHGTFRIPTLLKLADQTCRNAKE